MIFTAQIASLFFGPLPSPLTRAREDSSAVDVEPETPQLQTLQSLLKEQEDQEIPDIKLLISVPA